MSDAYRIVTAKVRQVRADSVMVEAPGRPNWVSIPRSLIHGGDDLKLDHLSVGWSGVEHTFRVREWKAEGLGLA